jgi:hypothetical protein
VVSRRVHCFQAAVCVVSTWMLSCAAEPSAGLPRAEGSRQQDGKSCDDAVLECRCVAYGHTRPWSSDTTPGLLQTRWKLPDYTDAVELGGFVQTLVKETPVCSGYASEESYWTLAPSEADPRGCEKGEENEMVREALWLKWGARIRQHSKNVIVNSWSGYAHLEWWAERVARSTSISLDSAVDGLVSEVYPYCGLRGKKRVTDQFGRPGEWEVVNDPKTMQVTCRRGQASDEP